MNLPRTVLKLAEEIVKKASNIESINGRSPTSVASAAIYLAAEVTQNSRTFEEIGMICGAAATTIKQIYKSMQTNINSILPSEYKNGVKQS